LSRFVLDCSVTMAWCFEDEADAYADRALDSLKAGSALVPALWSFEVANVLIVAERRRRLRRSDADAFLHLLARLPLEIDHSLAIHDISFLIAIGRDHRLSAYDAAYLRLAIRERLPIATRDMALRSAARALGIAHFSP